MNFALLVAFLTVVSVSAKKHKQGSLLKVFKAKNSQISLHLTKEPDGHHFRTFNLDTLIDTKIFSHKRFYHQYKCLEKDGDWCSKEVRYKNDGRVEIYKNGNLIHNYDQKTFYRLNSSSGCYHANTQSIDVTTDQIDELTHFVEDIHVGNFDFSNQCSEMPGGLGRFKRDVSSSIKQGIECLSQQGLASQKDALGMKALFFLENQFKVECVDQHELIKLEHSDGNHSCVSLGTSDGKMPGTCHSKFPLMMISKNLSPGQKGLFFHEAFHALGYFHNDGQMDYTYLADFCCFPERTNNQKVQKGACELLKNRGYSFENLRKYQYIMNNSNLTNVGTENSQRMILGQIKKTKWHQQGKRNKLIKQGLTLLRDAINQGINDPMELYYRILRYEMFIPKKDTANKRLAAKIRSELNFNLSEPDETILQQLAKISTAHYFVASPLWANDFRALHGAYNRACRSGHTSQIPDDLIKKIGPSIFFQNSDSYLKWIRLTAEGKDCKNRPARHYKNYINHNNLFGPLGIGYSVCD